MFGQHDETPAVIGFQERNYRYKSITTQITHDARLSQIPYIGRKLLSHRVSNQFRFS